MFQQAFVYAADEWIVFFDFLTSCTCLFVWNGLMNGNILFTYMCTMRSCLDKRSFKSISQKDSAAKKINSQIQQSPLHPKHLSLPPFGEVTYKRLC